jgi:lipopolysaccharide biosynthesis glycosyltransferase
MSGRRVRIRHLLADLSRAETRGGALRRVRVKAISTLGATVGRGDGGSRAARGGSGARRPDSWYFGEWTRLATAVLGRDGTATPDAAAGPGIRKTAARHHAEAVFAHAIERGESLERATAVAVAALAEQVEHHAAWSLAEGVGRLPGGATASAIGHGVLHHRRRQLHRAWARFRDLDPATLAATVPVEAVDAALADGTDDGLAVAMAVSVPDRSMDAAVAVDLAGRFLAMGHRAPTAALVEELRKRPAPELDDRRRYALALIERWLEPAPAQVPPGSIPIGILDYKSPDHVLTSGNLGDYIQTLSLVGNIARLVDVTITGEGGLGEVATELQGRVRADLRRPGVGGALHLIPVDRDFSTGRDVPDGTWLIAFGWHMHSLFDLRYDFPYHPAIRPLFLSFHVNRLDMLSDAALAYLRAHGPVGCRDWTTVFLQLGAGVDAFFSGCLTSTVDSLFPTRSEAYRGGGAVGVIDQPASAAGRNARTVRTYGHQSDEYRYLTAAEGLRAADRALADYQRDLDRVVTGRLHAYLPLTSLGVPVEFRTRNPGDVRFAGLTGMQPGDLRLDEMREGIRDLTAAVFERILGGAAASEVYELWRELTAARVEEAKARFAEPVEDEPTTIDVAAAVAVTAAARRRFGPHDAVDPGAVTDVVLAYDQNLTTPAAVLIESIVANASGPLRLWVLSRGLSDAYQSWLAGAFPSLPITFLPCDTISFGGTDGRPRRVPAHITVSTMDRLLLPDILTEVARVVYLDVDTLMFGDVCELAATDLGGFPVAARDSNVSEASQWQRAGRGLEEPLATELRRRVSHAHGFGHPALNAGVLVMDLDRMRRDRFTSTYLGWVERYGLHDQDTMLGYLGPRRGLVDPRWNVMPVLEDVAEPKLIHWASFGKPWDAALTFEQTRWREVAARLRERAGDAPAGGDERIGPAGSLHNPVELGPVTSPLGPEIERVIAGVRAEHLSYLDVTSLRTLAAMVQAVEADGIEGLVIEAGTARGGSAITLAAAKAPGRRMKVYDVFGMIPPPSEKDGEDVHKRYATIVAGRSQGVGGDTYYGYRDELLAEVTDSFARHGLPVGPSNVDLVQGRFEDTLVLDEPVAFAHLDGDWYASTMTCLTRIAPLLAIGGRIVVDDYDTWSGCRTAVHEYFSGRPGYRFERRGRLHIVRT